MANNTASTILRSIVASKKAEVELLKASRMNAGLPIDTEKMLEINFQRCFQKALLNPSTIPVIAEIKRKSPSAGEISGMSTDPRGIAMTYQEAGASCISVLTDAKYFGGSLNDLISVASCVSIPIIRKDFVIDECQIFEAKENGASAILLIVAILGDKTPKFVRACNKVQIECVVEVHAEEELEIALGSGVNCRDLHTFATDLRVAEHMIKKLPTNVVRICESGIQTPQDGNRMLKAGFDALLIGEALMRSNAIEEFLKALSQASRVARTMNQQ